MKIIKRYKSGWTIKQRTNGELLIVSNENKVVDYTPANVKEARWIIFCKTN